MISQLRGTLVASTLSSAVVDVQGIGFELAVSGETAGPTNTAGPNIVWLVAPAPASASPAASLEAMTLRLLATAGLPLSRTEIETTLQLDKNRSTRVLRNLERQGKVVRQGRSRATRYRLA